MLFFLGLILGLLILPIFKMIIKISAKNRPESNLNFRPGGVGIKNIDYGKVVEVHKDFLTKLANKSK